MAREKLFDGDGWGDDNDTSLQYAGGPYQPAPQWVVDGWTRRRDQLLADHAAAETADKTVEAFGRIERGESTFEEEFGPLQSWDEIAQRMRVKIDLPPDTEL